MAYNKEYYEKHKEEIKRSRDKYRHNLENREKINKQQRERYQNLPKEERQKRIEHIRQKRLQNIEKSRIQYRIDLRKRQIKKYFETYNDLEHKMFMLKMVDHWESEDYKYADQLFEQIHKVKTKIDKKNEELKELEIQKEKA